MPKAPRKRKVGLLKNPDPKKGAIPTAVTSLAAEYELDLAEMLDWKVYPSGKVVLIAPNGMKLVREVELETTLDTADPNASGNQHEVSVACADGVPSGVGVEHE